MKLTLLLAAALTLPALAGEQSPGLCAYTPDVLARPRLRGVMSPGGNMDEDDFKTLHEWGATLLRFQMVRDWHGVNGNQDLDEYDRWLDGRLDHFDTVVLPLARKYGMTTRGARRQYHSDTHAGETKVSLILLLIHCLPLVNNVKSLSSSNMVLMWGF